MLIKLVPGVYVNPDVIASVSERYDDLAFIVTLKDGREFTRYIDEVRVDYIYSCVQKKFSKFEAGNRRDGAPIRSYTREEVFSMQVANVITYLNTGQWPKFRAPSVRGDL